METIHYPPVAAVTLAYPLTALQPGRLDAAGRLPGESSESGAGGTATMPADHLTVDRKRFAIAQAGCNCAGVQPLLLWTREHAQLPATCQLKLFSSSATKKLRYAAGGAEHSRRMQASGSYTRAARA